MDEQRNRIATATALPITPLRQRPSQPRQNVASQRQRALLTPRRRLPQVTSTTTTRPALDDEYEYYYEYYYDEDEEGEEDHQLAADVDYSDRDLAPASRRPTSTRNKPVSTIDDYDLVPLSNKVSSRYIS